MSPRSRRAGACAAAALSVLALAGCGSSGPASAAATSPSALAADVSAPNCLPASINHSGQIPGTSVDVSPEPGSATANPDTQISFLGAPASSIHVVSVVGARSGGHSGRLEAYSQRDGASFVLAKPLQASEQVTVKVAIGASGHAHDHSFSFATDTPWSTASTGEFANPQAAPPDYQSFDTLPGVQAPVLTVTTADRDPAAGDILTTNGPGPGHYGAYIYNAQGRLVWVDQVTNGIAADDLNIQTYQGQRDLTLWQGRVLSLGFGQGEDLVLNSRYQTVATVRAGNGLQADLHDFQIAADDVAYVTTYNPIRCNLSSVGGAANAVILDAAAQAIDMKTGLVRWEWHSLDHVNVNESETSPPKGGAWDWFHINSIDPESDGDILISARNTWAAYQIAGASGRILWRLGGLKSSFKMGAGTRTAWQHDGRVLPDGDITLFDDGSDPTEPGHSQSRAVRVAVNTSTHQAKLVAVYTHPGEPLLAASQGNVETLASGDTVVGYGGVPEISEYAANGSLLFDAHYAFDLIFYRAFRYPWSATPSAPPAVVASLNNTALETIVHMSWNGATGVSSWRVLAGSSSGSLKAQTTVAVSGFETAAILPRTFASAKAHTLGYVEVQALGSNGRVLATSRPAEVSSFAASLPSDGRSG